MDVLFSPPVAFLIYAALFFSLVKLKTRTARRTALYASGETHPTKGGLPGFRASFVFAMFFAVLHIGGLVLATSVPGTVALVYLGGLAFSLIALLLG